jgi:hypothetical protein
LAGFILSAKYAAPAFGNFSGAVGRPSPYKGIEDLRVFDFIFGKRKYIPVKKNQVGLKAFFYASPLFISGGVSASQGKGVKGCFKVNRFPGEKAPFGKGPRNILPQKSRLYAFEGIEGLDRTVASIGSSYAQIAEAF